MALSGAWLLIPVCVCSRTGSGFLGLKHGLPQGQALLCPHLPVGDSLDHEGVWGFSDKQETGFDSWVRKISWRRNWQPTPVFLPGKSYGQRSLAGCSSWGQKELDMTDQLILSLPFPFWQSLGGKNLPHGPGLGHRTTKEVPDRFFFFWLYGLWDPSSDTQGTISKQ